MNRRLTETEQWLRVQHHRIMRAELTKQHERNAPPEVLHRRVNGETVIQRRLTNTRMRRNNA